MAIRKPAPKKTTKTSKAKAAPKKTAAAKKVTTASKKTVKKPVKKAVQKTIKKIAKKTSPKKKKAMAVGTSFECAVCGLEVSVENVCGCADACDLICCGEPMEMI